MFAPSIQGLLAFLALACAAVGQSAYGISLPLRGAQEAVAGPNELKPPVIDEATGLDKVEGRTLDIAATGAAKQVVEKTQPKGQSKFRRIEGASLFEDAQGNVGIMVTGEGKYSSDFPNPDATRMARRSAYVAAYADAMRLLTEKVYGSELAQKMAILKKLKSEVTEAATASEELSESQEEINDKISGLIRGAQTWKCEDEGSRVRVWIFTTQESAKASRVIGPDCKVTTVAGYQAAVDSILDECVNGFLPPIGGKYVVEPSSGVVTFVGFGSAIIKSTPLGETSAIKASELRAKAGLVGIMSGEQVDYLAQLSAQEAQAASDYKEYAKSQPPAGQEQDLAARARKSFKTVEALNTSITLAVSGRLPPGTQNVSFVDDDSGWVTSVYIYTVGSEDIVAALRADTPTVPATKSGEKVEPSAPARRPQYDPNRRGPSGEGKDPRSQRK